MKFLLPVVLMITLAACGGKQREVQSGESLPAPQKTTRVQKQPAMLEIAGTVRAADVAQLASRFGGFVQKVEARSGKHVRKGDLLIVVDDRGLQAQADKVRSAQDELHRAMEEVRQHWKAAESQKQLAFNTLERMRALYEKKSVSKQEFEEAENRSIAAEASWKAAGERVAQVEAKLRQAESDSRDVSASISYQRIVAPFDGLITSVPAEAGGYVNPGQTVVTMETLSKFQFVFSLEQELLPSVRTGMPLEIRIPVLSDAVLNGTVVEVSPSMDIATRTFQIKADLQSETSLQTGLSGRAVLRAPSRSTLWIPASFLKRTSEIETVLVHSGNEWRRVLVKAGEVRGEEVEILSGLNEGDEIGILEASK